MIYARTEGTRIVFLRRTNKQLEQIFALEPDGQDPISLKLKVERELLGLAGKDYRLILNIPPDNIFRRDVILPLALEENLRQAIGFEVDRYTPFKTEDVYFDFRVVNRNTERRQLIVDLAVVRKTKVDGDMTRFSALGLRVGGVIADEDALSEHKPLNFAPSPTEGIGRSPRKKWRTGLLFAALFLLGALLTIPLWQKRTSAIGLLPSLAKARASAQEADALRDKLDKMVVEHNFLLDKKWAGYSTLLILDELASRLKDDTFLTQLEFDGKTVVLLGESGSAAGLVEVLESSPVFKDVLFKSQLTKIQGTAFDRFHIEAVVEEGARAKPPSSNVSVPLPQPPASVPEKPATS